MSGNLFGGVDRDAYVFGLDQSGPVTIQVTESYALDPALRLWNEDTLTLVDVDLDSGPYADDAQIDTDLTAFARYSAEVFAEGFMGGDFIITLDGPNQHIDGTVALDANGDGTDSTSLTTEDSDYLNLVAPLTANGMLNLSVPPQAAAHDVVINLYDSAGVELARSDSSGDGGAESINFTGVVAGETYVLRIGESLYDNIGTVDIAVNFGTFLPTTWTAPVESYIPFHSTGVSTMGTPSVYYLPVVTRLFTDSRLHLTPPGPSRSRSPPT